MTREMSIRFDCPATGKRFPPGSNQMPQTEVHALFLPSSLSSPTIMSPDAQVGYVLAQQTHTHTHSHPLSRTLLSSNSSISGHFSALSRDPAS